jgi:iron complex transport system ATP-binding protein
MYFQTKDLTVGYSGKPLIKDINIGVEKGSILCLLGPNGSGKSTILKSITKHLKKIAGTVYIGKEDMDSFNSKETAKKISVMLTDRIAPEMTTCENVVVTGRYPYTNHFGSLTPDDRNIVENSMRMVNVLDFKNREFATLSDGQKQRVLLARAICQQPDIIVLDEPTSYLDIRYKIELLGILRKLAVERNITVVLSLHEVDLAAKLSDIIILVKDNRIFRCGLPEDVLSDDIIKELYSINSGSFNMLLGSVELPCTKSDAKVFIIGGDGCGTPCYRALQKKGISFSTGILHHNDVDYYVAKSLARQIHVEKSFQRISDGVLESAKQTITQCEAVIDSGFPIADGNMGNGLLLRFSQKIKKPLLSLRREPIPDISGANYYKDINSLINSPVLKKMSKEARK